MDIPTFVSMSAPQAQARARARSCGRRTTRGSSSESSSQASSSTASPVASPRSATARDSPGEDMEGVDAAASAGFCGAVYAVQWCLARPAVRRVLPMKPDVGLVQG